MPLTAEKDHALPFETCAEFLKSDIMTDVILCCGHRVAYCEENLKLAPDSAFWQEKLAKARAALETATTYHVRAQLGMVK